MESPKETSQPTNQTTSGGDQEEQCCPDVSILTLTVSV